ncbi:hypothetical protein DH86_00002475, partial [Scytalidium sp. 3C]
HSITQSLNMSEKDGRGISLRTKRKGGRPTISAPKQISAPISQSGGPTVAPSSKLPPAAIGQQRPQASGKTSDLVKRRYSTRFNNPPPGFNPTNPSVPSVPSLPSQYTTQNDRGRGPSPARGSTLTVDLAALRNPNFRPDQCMLLKSCLVGSQG